MFFKEISTNLGIFYEIIEKPYSFNWYVLIWDLRAKISKKENKENEEHLRVCKATTTFTNQTTTNLR